MAVTDRHIACWIFLLWIIAMAPDLLSQESPYDPAFAEEAAGIVEQVVICTDRSLYITGEELRFAGDIVRTGIPDGVAWSKVLYLELVSPDGRQLERGKYPVRQGSFNGEMNIPSGLLTGGYYLRGYTRWMRNRGPECYSYVPVRILNPFNQNLNQVSYGDALATELKEYDAIDAPVELKPQAEIVDRNDSVRLRLSLRPDDEADPVRGCLTVAPRLASPAPMLLMEDEGGSSSGAPFRVGFLPDLNGMTLSGTAVGSGSDPMPVPDRRMHLRLFGKHPDYLVVQSDSKGRFNLSLPLSYGNMELFIQPEDISGESTEIRIDQDFDPGHIQLPAIPFYLPDSQVNVVTAMARKTELAGIFEKPAPVEENRAAGGHVPFYGTPSFSLQLDDYVSLPTLEEIFINLVPMVTPVSKKNSVSLVIHSENPAIQIYPPLIMIDGIPVFDVSRLMSLPPAGIERIDVINDVYLKGEMKFGGIVNLQTREGDMSGIELPENAFFFDYRAFSPPSEPMDAGTPSNRIPDTRNTIYWIPDLEVSSEAPVHLTFPAPDYPGIYNMVYRGFTEKGKISTVEISFRVRDNTRDNQ